MRKNGSIIGVRNVPNIVTATGVWDLSDVRMSKLGLGWPDGSTAPTTGLLAAWDFSNSYSLYDLTSGGSNVAPDGEIARVEDQSGNGRHLTESTFSRRPLRKTNQINGLDVGLFDGIDDEISHIPTGFSNLYVLYVINPLLDTRYVVMGNLPESDRFDIAPEQGSGSGFSGVGINSCKIDGVSFTGTRNDLYNALIGTHCVNLDWDFSSWTRFGLSSYGGSYKFNGYFGEVLIYDKETSGAAVRDAAEYYLMSKWGIT